MNLEKVFRVAHTSRVRIPRILSPTAACAAVGWFILLLTPAAHAAENNAGGAKAFIVIDDKSKHVLLQSHAGDRLQIGSLTKIASAIVVLDWARLGGHTLDTEVSVPASVIESFHDNPIGFQPGDEVSLRDLLYAALLQSDGIATNTLAYVVGRELPAVPGEHDVKAANASIVRFVAQMNSLARTLNMQRTRFLNPVGMDDQERPFSTAADVGRLSRFALGKADFRFFIAQKERRITLKRAGQSSDYLLRNTNELLGVNNVDGGKTGTTARAGQCLMVTSERKPIVWQDGPKTYKTTRRLIVIVLGSPDRFRQASELIDEAIPIYDRWLASGHPMDPDTTL